MYFKRSLCEHFSNSSMQYEHIHIHHTLEIQHKIPENSIAKVISVDCITRSHENWTLLNNWSAKIQTMHAQLHTLRWRSCMNSAWQLVVSTNRERKKKQKQQNHNAQNIWQKSEYASSAKIDGGMAYDSWTNGKHSIANLSILSDITKALN